MPEILRLFGRHAVLEKAADELLQELRRSSAIGELSRVHDAHDIEYFDVVAGGLDAATVARWAESQASILVVVMPAEDRTRLTARIKNWLQGLGRPSLAPSVLDCTQYWRTASRDSDFEDDVDPGIETPWPDDSHESLLKELAARRVIETDQARIEELDEQIEAVAALSRLAR